MASVEIFCQNVKTILAQRNIRIKDLAEKIGLSESYLSLVLNGLRKNLNDEYKDRIASYLNLSLSQLYSEDLRAAASSEEAPVFGEDPDRKETAELLETFLSTTNLTQIRSSFYIALSSLNDKESRVLRTYLRTVLTDLARSPAVRIEPTASAAPLDNDELSLLALYSLAGDDARLEWVMSASSMTKDDFETITQRLVAKSVLKVRDDSGIRRSSPLGPHIQASSLYTLAKLKDIHLSLALAMAALPDEGPFFERAVAEHFLRAGKNKEALERFSKAAKLLESLSLWREAGETWHRSSILCGLLNDTTGRANCLAEAAKCLGAAGNFEEANEFGSYACRIIQEMGKPRSVAYVCIMMGYMMGQHDPDAGIDWYRRGLKVTDLDDLTRGILFGNLISTLLEAERMDEAENTIREARRWSAGRSEQDVGTLGIMIPMGLGLVEFRRRNWKSAKTHLEQALTRSEGSKLHMAWVWQSMGMLMYREDDQISAAEYLRKAQEAYQDLDMNLYSAHTGIELAKVALREGRFEDAAAGVSSAEPVLEEKSALQKAWASLIRGCIGRARGRREQAVDDGRKAVDIFQREEAERELALAALWLSDLYNEMGDTQQATFMERRAFQIYEKRHWDIRELHRERGLLQPKTGLESKPG
ncbi:MAG: helix-turn-helix domain-containing protein [Bacillota bacterium]